MNLRDYLGSWNGAKLLNKGLFAVLAGSVATNIILADQIGRKNEKIVFRPLGENGVMEVEKTSANLAYRKAWATTLAIQLGNITPANIALVKSTLEPILSPEVYACLNVEMEKQSIYLRKEALSMTYTPIVTKYEHETNRLFVVGDSQTVTAKTDSSPPVKRVFEFQLDIDNYRPVVRRAVSYFGEMRTSAWLAARTKDAVPPLTTLSSNHCIDNEKYDPS